MTSDWKLLHPQTSIASIPPLLVKYEFRASSYRIWVTDLSNVWTEALDQRPLVQRAWDIETDIDPIESDQRQMLLQKIRDCLDEGPSTKLALSRNEGSDDIQLTAFSPLPKPLKALRWPFFLTPSPRLALTNELVIPLLIEQLLFRKRLDSLLEILNDKDHVISKLTDKMQTEGLELGKVFPGAIAAKSSRKAISKEDFGRAVKGLGPFDESQWRTRWKEDPDVPENCQGLLSQLFARDTSLDLYRIGEQLADEHWWERISTESPLSDDVQEEVYQSQSQKSAADDFQRLSTPERPSVSAASGNTLSGKTILPQRGVKPRTGTQEAVDDSSTTGSSDEDLNAVQPESRQSQHKPRAAIEESSSSASSSPEPAHKVRQTPSPRPRGVLGRIGGASKPSVSPSKPKLGHIGGTSASGKPPKPASEPSEPRGRLVKQPESPPSPRETSRERADRKREQLKRELEEKSRVGAKKKRKF